MTRNIDALDEGFNIYVASLSNRERGKNEEEAER